MTKPKTADGYTPAQLEHVRATLLYLISILGDLLDELVVVGGLVPSLLVPTPAADEEAHVGTTDLDLGLEIALLDSGRYHTLAGVRTRTPTTSTTWSDITEKMSRRSLGASGPCSTTLRPATPWASCRGT
jgi:hypothetical protein